MARCRWAAIERGLAPLAGALGLVLLTACGSAARTGSGRGPTAENDPGMLHVHGLGIDPADGTVYAATHTGLFRIVDGRGPQRVGAHYHDLMGFTVTDDGRLIASGHPDLGTEELQRPGKPPLLGLVESRDQGATWVALSLLGEADFHVLRERHGRIYGFDSTGGRFLVSQGNGTWETRATDIALSDFVVSPDHPDLLVASAQGAVTRSDDAGVTWRVVSDRQLALMSWDDELIGMTPAGQVLVSDDEGSSWETRATLDGVPEALLARDGLLLSYLSDRGLVESLDGGETWTVLLAARPIEGAH